MKIEKIDRVAFVVKDLNEAAEFFENLLGIQFNDHVEAKELDIRVRYSPLGLQLNEAMTPESDVKKFIDHRGEGFYCIALKVSDIEEAKKELISKGIRHVRDFRVGNLKESVFDPRDTYGMMLVLAEYPDYHGATVGALEYGQKNK
jgi:methylmalonyl-CoA/ethylmalonyl-CoA epimerase